MKILRLNLFFYYPLFIGFLYGLGISDLVQNGFKGNVLLLIIEAIRYLFLEVIPYWWLLLIIVPLLMAFLNLAFYEFFRRILKQQPLGGYIFGGTLFVILMVVYLKFIDLKYWWIVILRLQFVR